MDAGEVTGAAGGPISRRGFVLGAAVCAACAWAGLTDLTAGPADAATRSAGHGGPRLLPRARTRTTSARRHDQPNAVFQVTTKHKMVALSFDDGPDPAFTPVILDTLARFDAKATFFVVGTNALAHPDLIARTRAEGHSFGNHTYDHTALDTLSGAEVTAELEKGRQALLSAGTRPTGLFRPPYGYTDRSVGLAANRARYTTVFWDACIEHYVNHTRVSSGVNHLVRGVNAGAVIVGHDGGTIAGTQLPRIDRSRTIEALPGLLEGLHRRGFKVVDVATLLGLRARAAAVTTV